MSSKKPATSHDRARAAIDLILEGLSKRRSTAAARRIMRACRTLDIDDPVDVRTVLSWLEYCDHNGEPFGGSSVERVWP